MEASVWDEILVARWIDSGAAERAHDAGSYCLAEAERVANREDEVPDPEILGIPEGKLGELVRVDLQNRDIGSRIGAQDLDVEPAPVIQGDGNAVPVLNDMVVRQDVAILRIDDHAGTATDPRAGRSLARLAEEISGTGDPGTGDLPHSGAPIPPRYSRPPRLHFQAVARGSECPVRLRQCHVWVLARQRPQVRLPKARPRVVREPVVSFCSPEVFANAHEVPRDCCIRAPSHHEFPLPGTTDAGRFTRRQPVFTSGQSTTSCCRSGANGSTAPSARPVVDRASGPTSRQEYWLRKMAFKGTNMAEFEQSAGRSWSGSPTSLVLSRCLPRFDQPRLAGQAGALWARGRGRVDPARADSSGRPPCQALRLPGSAVRPRKRIGPCSPDIRASSPGNASCPMPRADRMGITRGLPFIHKFCRDAASDTGRWCGPSG